VSPAAVFRKTENWPSATAGNKELVDLDQLEDGSYIYLLRVISGGDYRRTDAALSFMIAIAFTHPILDSAFKAMDL
jgi:hypothetical protein